MNTSAIKTFATTVRTQLMEIITERRLDLALMQWGQFHAQSSPTPSH